MAFGFSRTRVSPIAIDFGSERLKLLQIVPGHPSQLVAAASARVPENARHDPAARHRFLIESLRSALKDQPFKGRRAICSLPAYQSLVQNLEIGRADEQELDALVADQLRQRLNVDPNRMVIRHHSLGQVVRNGTTMQQVLCLAASRETVMQYINLCGECRLDVVGMHSEPMAILRAFADTQSQNGKEPQTVCYIDIGAATSKLVIAHGPSIVFAKTVHAAGQHMSEVAATGQQMISSGSDARHRVHHTNMPESVQAGAVDVSHADQSDQTGLAMLDTSVEAAQANGGNDEAAGNDNGKGSAAASESSIDNDTVECLIDELRMCLRYHQSLFPRQPVQKLVFLGGEARQVQTCQRIARAVRVAAQLGDPLASLSRMSASKPPLGVSFDEPQPGWAVPFGLCHSEANM